MAHDATRPQRLWLIGTPGRDRRRLRVQVRTQSKSIECSFNVVSIVLPQCRFNVVYSADRPLIHATFQSNCAEGLHFSAFN